MVPNFKFFKGFSFTERKITASWSPELVQDLSAYHYIDAEAELTALLSRQIASEVDREILNLISFPIVRRVFTNPIGNDLVSVQPMAGPNGLFYLDYKYETIINTFKFGR